VDAHRGDTGGMLGAAQAVWFVNAVAGSRARWKIIARDQPVGE
jgi:phosphodiesterase/alkaline phosphatase D-like protein